MGSQGSSVFSGDKLRLLSDCAYSQTDLRASLYASANLYLMLDTASINVTVQFSKQSNFDAISFL